MQIQIPPVHVHLITPHIVWYLDWNFWVSAGTFAVALTTAYYAWETRRLRQGNDTALETTRAALNQQTEDTKRSRELAEMNSKAAAEGVLATKQLTEIGQRPWVSHRDAVGNSRSTSDASLITIEIQSQLFNSGQTPALELQMAQVLKIFDDGIPEKLEYPGFTEESTQAPLGPNSASFIPCRDEFFSAEFFAARDKDKKDKKVLCLYGRAVYRDCFEKTHETKWCLFYGSEQVSDEAQSGVSFHEARFR